MKHPLTIVMLILIVAADQISKFYVLTGAVEIIRLNDFLNITHVWNEGVSFGLFAGASSNLIFLCLTGVIAIILAYLLLQAHVKYIAITYAFILGGALGNIIDRIRYGAVFDFIDTHLADMHWPAFNIADSFICIGGAMLIWNMVFSKKVSIYMKKKLSISINFLTIFMAIFLLNSCDKVWSLSNATPDESIVLKRPPLSVPPDFHLPPPQEKESSTEKKKSIGKSYKVAKSNSDALAKDSTSEDLTTSDKLFIKKFRKAKHKKRSPHKNTKKVARVARSYSKKQIKQRQQTDVKIHTN